MRVALVSAHYPPNFVSGGTLVPQRIAHGLADRGHDVAVFAGRLDDAEDQLSIFTERDDRGVPVTWINTTPWTAWNDPRNVDNPEVHSRFESWLVERSPDVVHFHSLQTLGASLVTAAREAGCRTVVTMHDYWWLCARQFLVDLAYRPCSVVVAAGNCTCQSGRRHLDERNRLLARHLAAADVVLAPSSAAAEILRANGIAPDRLEVNENGMSGAPARSMDTSPAERGSVRFRYTGGGDPMKGADFLCDAVPAVTTRGSWQLIVHAPPGRPGSLSRLRDHPNVVFEPPYDPDDLDAVLDETDVLVLPSMARETHSIMTREALLRGVPVITTDCIGPEQVVHHDVNGLVVSSLDPNSLAAALRRVVEEPALLPQLRSASRPVVWTVDEQVDRLETVLARPRPREAPAWTPRSVVYLVGIDGAPLRYRAQFPAEALGLVGVDTAVLHYSDPRVESAVARADAVIVYRVPATPRVLEIIDGARAGGTPVVFDVDDLIVDPSIQADISALRSLPQDELALWRQGVDRYRTTLEHCDGYLGSTETLVDRVSEVTGLPSYLKPNAYGLDLARRSDEALWSHRESGPVRIGYFSGTKTHDEDLRSVVPAMVELLDGHADLELWLGGLLPDVEQFARFGVRVRRLPLYQWHDLPAALRQVDVNLAPLADPGTFNQSKSAIKWLEAALTATPTVASATSPFRAAITDGVTGVLVPFGGDWRAAVERLVVDEGERARMGAAARRRALVAWSPHEQGQLLLDILREVREVAAPGRRTAWSDVTVDEPAASSPIALSPYPSGSGFDGTRDNPVADAPTPPGLAHKLWWSLRNESPVTVGRRVVRRFRR